MSLQRNLEEEVTQLIADIIEIDSTQINLDAKLVEDLGMDSMMALEILAAIEKKFRVRIPEEDLPSITSLRRAIEMTKKYVK